MTRTPRRGLCGTAVRTAATLVVVAFALGATRCARAQEDPRPSLAGHTFVATDLVPDAFVRTYVRTSLGYAGAQSIDYPPVVFGSDTLHVLSGSLTYATLGLEYQGRLRDWIATRIALGLVTRLGTQGSSLVNEGVTVNQGYDFGFLVRLRQSPKSMLCGTLGVTNQSVTIIDVHQFAEDVANGVPNARLIDYVPAVRSTAGLRFAWAASSAFGVTVLGSSSYGDAPRRHELTSWGWDLGASVDYDAAPGHGIPVGAALAYRLTSQPGLTTTDNGNSSQTVLRIAYTGGHSLVALDILGLFDRQNTLAESIWAGGLAFSMRSYF
jgi:hypothetical protein